MSNSQIGMFYRHAEDPLGDSHLPGTHDTAVTQCWP